MNVRRLAVLLLLPFAAWANGQGLDEYLKQRKKYGVSQAVGIPALEAFIGKRTLEVRGTVTGYFRVNGRDVLLVDRGDGEAIHVQSPDAPEWLEGGPVSARMLIRAERDDEFGELRAWLIGAASEADIEAIERREAQKAAQAARAAKVVKPPAKPANVKSGKDWNLPVSEVTPIYAGFIKERNRRLSDSEAWRIASGIIGFSVMYGVDARLIMAMVMAESGFNPAATSRVGAIGLGQLMPGTARGMGLSNAYDTNQNLYATVRIVRGHLERYGKKVKDGYDALILMLAAYNAGSGAVRRHGGVPPYRETQNYIRKVVANYRALRGD